MTLTDFLAVWGALLSTYLAYREVRKGRRQIRVTCSVGRVPVPVATPTFNRAKAEMIIVRAVNNGYRLVELRAAELGRTDGRRFTHAVGPIALPQKLEDGESVDIFFDLLEIKKKLKEEEDVGLGYAYTRAFVRDAEGNEYSARIPDGAGVPVEKRPWWRFWR